VGIHAVDTEHLGEILALRRQVQEGIDQLAAAKHANAALLELTRQLHAKHDA
jgi:hypothetical protein